MRSVGSPDQAGQYALGRIVGVRMAPSLSESWCRCWVLLRRRLLAVILPCALVRACDMISLSVLFALPRCCCCCVQTIVGTSSYLLVVNLFWPDRARDVLRAQIVRSLLAM